MKKLLSALTIFALLSSCEHDSTQDLKKGFIQLSFSSNEFGKKMDTPDPAFVLLDITDDEGNLVEGHKKLPLYSFGNGYVSESLQLITGHYKLTKFMVLDANNKVIYATPLEGSDLAGLVKDPLPINFTITENGSTLVTPEVLEVTEENSPESFGYVNFGFDVVEVPSKIKVSFLMPPLPYFTTNGYDSVVVTLSSGQKKIVEKLNVISAIEAAGDFSESEITTNGIWTVIVKAYYEVIDEVPYNFHVNESITTLNVSLDNHVDKIEIRESTLGVIRSNASDTHLISWNHRAHMTDETGYFHLVLDNDFCSPNFKYDILKSDVALVHYEKGWYDINSLDFMYLFATYWGIPNPISKGSYTDNSTFDGINCDSVNPEVFNDPFNPFPYFYFYARHDNYTGADCFIIWDSIQDPHDPSKGGRSKENSSDGYFRMTSSGIEKHRAEALARMKK